MRSGRAARGVVRSLALLLGVVLLAPDARALSYFDGRLEVHGFYEAQIRSLVRDYNTTDGWDLSQWYNVLNIEIEGNLAPNGWGPFDVISFYSRIEARYDCVWSGGCSLFDSADTYSSGRYGQLPKRLLDARRTGYQGEFFMGDRRRWRFETPYTEIPYAPDSRTARPDGERAPLRAYQTPLLDGFFGFAGNGSDGIPEYLNRGVTAPIGFDQNAGGQEGRFIASTDDPPFFFFQNILGDHCQRWGARNMPGTQNGKSEGDTLLLSTDCDYKKLGAAAGYPNPFNSQDFNPLIGTRGSAALPFRPAPDLPAAESASLAFARGNWYPNARLQQLIRDDKLSPLKTNYTETEMAWNHGQAQESQRELKELYADIEMFDSRLFMRIGYQTIVWGKTELFRNQDTFNPQDVGLSSLPDLEESRISLWALRAIWSFYDVGPLNDVRLEVAMNFDQYQPIDAGVCGEPYAPLAVCQLPVGLISHGYFDVGLAGAILPPNPWDSSRGLEEGVRLEFRWDRFSFAITDFYGYQDFPYLDQVFLYSRNVDPVSGRPRYDMTTLPCRTGDKAGCLDPKKALTDQSVNQTLFSAICFTTLAVAPTLDPTACLANIFGSPAETPPQGATPGPRVVVALNMIARGDIDVGGQGTVFAGLAEFPKDGSVQKAIGDHTYNGQQKVTVNLNIDPNDGPSLDLANATRNNPLVHASDFFSTVQFFYSNLGGSLSARLTTQQEALLGCGAFYHTSCDLDGVDFLNMEAGVIFQSWPNVQGTFRGNNFVWDTTNKHLTQPGTVGFQGGPLCTRFENGKSYVLPGCRGPGDPGYDPRIDGTITGLKQPFTGQQFENELAALSWNLLMGLVGFSLPPRAFGDLTGPRGTPRKEDFDNRNPFRHGGCSFAEPQWCSNVAAIIAISGQERPDIQAGGNGMFGRRDFVYHSGGDGVLKVGKNNTFGFSADWAEDYTKSNWGLEFTWVKDVIVGDNNAASGLATDPDFYRLTISVDRPTFVNFLNANRTFFINTQWFVQYTDGFKKGFTGPLDAWDIFGVLAISTGYFQDRLLPSLTLVYFVRNNSFAVLPQVTYRFTENFQASIGLAGFAGREQTVPSPIDSLAPAQENFGRDAFKSFVEPGLAIIRERDEIFLRIRYTF